MAQGFVTRNAVESLGFSRYRPESWLNGSRNIFQTFKWHVELPISIAIAIGSPISIDDQDGGSAMDAVDDAEISFLAVAKRNSVADTKLVGDIREIGGCQQFVSGFLMPEQSSSHGPEAVPATA